MEKKQFIFDLDGTLLVPDYSYEEEYFKSVLSREDAERFIPMLCDLVAGYERTHSRYNVGKLSEYLTGEGGVVINTDIVIGWRDALEKTSPQLIDGVVDALEYLRGKDKNLVILTNWFLKPQITRLEKAGIKDYFTEFYGGECALKPNSESYRIACGSYSVEEAVMIGDSLDNDVYGAMAVGMDAVYYNPKNKDNYDKNKVKSIGSMKMIKEMF